LRKRISDAPPNIDVMKKVIFLALFILTVMYPFKSHKGSVKATDEQQIERIQRIGAAEKLTRRNVYNYLYHLTKDSAKTDLYFRILINESQLKSELALKHNNICGMRDWEKNRMYFTGLTKSKYCIYPHWRDSVKDLVQYMDFYGKRAWYFRFNSQLKKISTDLDEPKAIY
jgi:hypothetical protein